MNIRNTIHFLSKNIRSTHDQIRLHRPWLRTTEDSWDTALFLFENKKFTESLFYGHLAIEKYLKTIWIKDNSDDEPPRIHNLVRLAQETTLTLSHDELRFLLEFNVYQMQSRYPDYGVD